MQKLLIREMTIFVILLVTLAFVMHPDLLSTPTERFSIMQDRSNYIHPFLYAFIIYIVLFIFRFIVKKVINLFTKLKNR